MFMELGAWQDGLICVFVLTCRNEHLQEVYCHYIYSFLGSAPV